MGPGQNPEDRFSHNEAHMSCDVRKHVFGVSNSLPYKEGCTIIEARGLKFHIQEVEGLYYSCSENKATDQLCGYRTTDLRLCFRIMQKSSSL